MSRRNRAGGRPGSRQAGTGFIVDPSLRAVFPTDGGPDATCGPLVGKGAGRPGGGAPGLQVQESNTGYRDCRVGSLLALEALLKELNVTHAAARPNVTLASAHAERTGPYVAAEAGASLRGDGSGEGCRLCRA
ncbi:hypothetical protein [Methylobacterium radiotolerans]|uniref:hypothetical protein n=1 Tax=Methylobacterium radiotolerans TaxID=31998 RepID=UPI0010582962|nr:MULTISPECIES: hypothetical protein [Methylobacterium]MDE3747832.1 hypothetical protein [Methylobacterium radiotolerans]